MRKTIKMGKFFCNWLFFLGLTLLPSFTQASSLSEWQIINYMNQSDLRRCAVAIDTCIYVLGGYWYGNTVERAFVNTTGNLNTWEYMNPMSMARYGFAAVLGNNHIYAIAGERDWSSITASSVEVATINSDFSLSAWTVVNYLPFKIYSHAAVTWNNNIYVIGGQNTTYLASVLRSHINPDGSLTPWEVLSTSLNIPRADLTAVVWNSYIYAIGGAGGGTANTTERAQIFPDGSLGLWTCETALLVRPSRMQHAAVVANNYIYVLGGYGIEGPFTASKRVERQPILLDGHLGVAQEVSPMVQRRQAFPAVCINNRYIYALGGFDTSELSSVEMAEILPTAVNPSLWQLYE